MSFLDVEFVEKINGYGRVIEMTCPLCGKMVFDSVSATGRIAARRMRDHARFIVMKHINETHSFANVSVGRENSLFYAKDASGKMSIVLIQSELDQDGDEYKELVSLSDQYIDEYRQEMVETIASYEAAIVAIDEYRKQRSEK